MTSSILWIPLCLFANALVLLKYRSSKRRKIRESISNTNHPVGFIFDLDGTLLDFEGASHLALNAPLQKFGKTVDWSLHASIVGTPKKHWSVQILKDLNIDLTKYTPDQFAHEWHEHIATAFPTMELLPGALELVQTIKRKFPEAKLAIATSSERKNFDLKMSYHPKLLNLFDAVVTGNEVENGKPHPDIFLEAAKRIQVNPIRCIIFEDSHFGIAGGQKAGCMTVAIPDSRFSGYEHMFKSADIILNSLLEMTESRLDMVYSKLKHD